MSKPRFLGVIIVLQGMILAGQWLGAGASYVSSAQAQIADPARDRQQTLEEMKQINAKLDKLIELLRSGEVQIKVVQPAQPAGRGANR
jgi:hypothetical protein